MSFPFSIAPSVLVKKPRHPSILRQQIVARSFVLIILSHRGHQPLRKIFRQPVQRRVLLPEKLVTSVEISYSLRNTKCRCDTALSGLMFGVKVTSHFTLTSMVVARPLTVSTATVCFQAHNFTAQHRIPVGGIGHYLIGRLRQELVHGAEVSFCSMR